MVLYQSSDGERVHAIRRGSDGSAFQNWEEFLKTCKDGDGFEIDKKGFKTWKNMSNEADKLNAAYVQLLLKEESEMQWVNDAAAHSADVPKGFERALGLG